MQPEDIEAMKSLVKKYGIDVVRKGLETLSDDCDIMIVKGLEYNGFKLYTVRNKPGLYARQTSLGGKDMHIGYSYFNRRKRSLTVYRATVVEEMLAPIMKGI